MEVSVFVRMPSKHRHSWTHAESTDDLIFEIMWHTRTLAAQQQVCLCLFFSSQPQAEGCGQTLSWAIRDSKCLGTSTCASVLAAATYFDEHAYVTFDKTTRWMTHQLEIVLACCAVEGMTTLGRSFCSVRPVPSDLPD